jgi:membrane-bound lytic murein transglycosylase A
VAGFLGAMLCTAANPTAAEEPLKLAGTQLEPIKWTELRAWSGDDHLAAFAAYQASCQALRRSGHADERRPVQGALLNVCRRALGISPRNAQAARAFFEENFQPVRIARLGEQEGLLTGYFEPVVPQSGIPCARLPPPA